MYVIVRWPRVILRRDSYGVEESVKFGTKNHFCIRNKFSLGATCANYPGGERAGISILDITYKHENEADQ